MALNTNFHRNIERLAVVAKHTSSPQQIFQDLIQVGFNSMVDSRSMVRLPRFIFGWDQELRTELTAYKRQPEAWALLGQTCAMWLQAIQAGQPFEDILGGTYDEHLGQRLGQFFTPSDVSSLIGGISLAASDTGLMEKLKAGKAITLSDPCGCGGGSMLLAQLRSIHSTLGADALKLVHVEGQDLDRSMVQLTATQLFYSASAHGLPLGAVVVRWGNVLTEPTARVGFSCVYEPRRTNSLVDWLTRRSGMTEGEAATA